ncbi:MAG: 4Fe-4S dicluster domain-containing protein [Thermodesulfobacteriota bacterium]
MKWSPEAEDALRGVPFFVRKKVRLRVEDDARRAGHSEVTLADVHESRKRFLQTMSSEVRGYQLDTCFGSGDCPNRAVPAESLRRRLETVLKDADLLAFLKSEVAGDLKLHHEFRVTLAECPNACSQPQIKDIGILGAVRPGLTDTACTGCNACVEVCPDDAVRLDENMDRPVLDMSRCQSCGLCVNACPTGTISAACRGYRILVGGKLGRHPRLARELPGIYDEDGVLDVVRDCLDHYKQTSRNGRRFAEILTDDRFRDLAERK